MARRRLTPAQTDYLAPPGNGGPEAAARTTLKIYRLEHRTIPVEALIGRIRRGDTGLWRLRDVLFRQRV